jgi:hypothetical protein
MDAVISPSIRGAAHGGQHHHAHDEDQDGRRDRPAGAGVDIAHPPAGRAALATVHREDDAAAGPTTQA